MESLRWFPTSRAWVASQRTGGDHVKKRHPLYIRRQVDRSQAIKRDQGANGGDVPHEHRRCRSARAAADRGATFPTTTYRSPQRAFSTRMNISRGFSGRGSDRSSQPCSEDFNGQWSATANSLQYFLLPFPPLVFLSESSFQPSCAISMPARTSFRARAWGEQRNYIDRIRDHLTRWRCHLSHQNAGRSRTY